MSNDFSAEQKRYLEGFMSGLQVARVGRTASAGKPAGGGAEPMGPEAAHLKAQNETLARGGAVSPRAGRASQIDVALVLLASGLGELVQRLFRQLQVRVDALDVVQLFEPLHQPKN